MKIIFFDYTIGDHEDYVRQELNGHTVEFTSQTVAEYSKDRSLEDVEAISIFVTSKFDAEQFKNFPQLRFITTRSTGFDHVDLATAEARDVKVANVPFYGSNTVAEHAFALLLSLTRKIPESYERVKDGTFTYEGLQGVDLMGKTMGVVGGGHIGIHVAQIANGFGMNVLVYDIHPDPALSTQYHFQYEPDLDKLLSQSDVVSLHLPLNEHTAHIINEERLAHFKQGSYLINTARGGLVETDALVRALHDRRLAGVGIDVLEGEEFLKNELQFLSEEHTEEEMRSVLEDHILLEQDNVVVTPHNAFNTKEAHFRNLQTTVENIKAFITGSPQNLVK